MKVVDIGDIIYVINPYKLQVGSSTIPHDYHFVLGHKYKITRIYFNGYGIVNITTNDDITHFLPNSDNLGPFLIKSEFKNSMIGCFVTSNKWRELQLEKIGI